MVSTVLSQSVGETRAQVYAKSSRAREERAAAADSVALGGPRERTDGLIQNQGVIKSSRIFYGPLPEEDTKAGFPAEREVGREVEFQSGLVLRQDNASHSVSVLQRGDDGTKPIAVLDNTWMLMPMENPQPNVLTSLFGVGRRPEEESTVMLQGPQMGEMIDVNGTITIIDRSHGTEASPEVINALSLVTTLMPFAYSPFGFTAGMLPAMKPMEYDRYTIRPENANSGPVEGTQFKRHIEPFVPKLDRPLALSLPDDKNDGDLPGKDVASKKSTKIASLAMSSGPLWGAFPLCVAVTRPHGVEATFDGERIKATRAMDFGEPKSVSLEPLVAPSLFQLPSGK